MLFHNQQKQWRANFKRTGMNLHRSSVTILNVVVDYLMKFEMSIKIFKIMLTVN